MVRAAACLGAALPVAVSTIRGLADHVYPNGDRAIIATRAYDVFSSHTPLLGQISASSLLLHRETHSLGPLLYWLLAVPVRVGPAAMVVTIGAVNAAAAIGIVLLARRRGGTALMLVAAAMVALLCRSLVAETWHDIWNPSAGVLPLTLLMFLCWSLACGELRLLPLTVLVASFTAQCELTYLLPSVALVAVGVCGLAVSRARSRGDPGRPRALPWSLAGVAVAAACWSAPLVDQALHRPGNLVLVVRAALLRKPTVGVEWGWRAVEHAVGIPPWFLRVPRTPFDPLADVSVPASTLAAVSTIVVLCGLVAAVALGLRRRRGDVVAAASIGLLLCAALAAGAAATPARPFLRSSLGYTLWWGYPAGAWCWLACGWSASTLFGSQLAAVPNAVRRWARPAAAAIAVTVGCIVAASQQPDQDLGEYQPVRTTVAAVEAWLPHNAGTVLVTGSSDFTAFDFKAPLVYALRRAGAHPVLVGGGWRLGSFYEARGRRRSATLYVWNGPAPRRHGTVIARAAVPGAVGGTVTVTASLPRRR